ncbi:hypothetical protein B0O99DRAFT_691141 [Bisporella sp. PMI_857]|nr:hypothetical protein B0O99DRAFT_691141 [Bisporella sp. PMI_857]
MKFSASGILFAASLISGAFAIPTEYESSSIKARGKNDYTVTFASRPGYQDKIKPSDPRYAQYEDLAEKALKHFDCKAGGTVTGGFHPSNGESVNHLQITPNGKCAEGEAGNESAKIHAYGIDGPERFTQGIPDRAEVAPVPAEEKKSKDPVGDAKRKKAEEAARKKAEKEEAKKKKKNGTNTHSVEVDLE